VDISLIQVDNIDIWRDLHRKTTSLEALLTESGKNIIEKLGKNFTVWSEWRSPLVQTQNAVDKNVF
jgi:hypothetical protein